MAKVGEKEQTIDGHAVRVELHKRNVPGKGRRGWRWQTVQDAHVYIDGELKTTTLGGKTYQSGFAYATQTLSPKRENAEPKRDELAEKFREFTTEELVEDRAWWVGLMGARSLERRRKANRNAAAIREELERRGLKIDGSPIQGNATPQDHAPSDIVSQFTAAEKHRKAPRKAQAPSRRTHGNTSPTRRRRTRADGSVQYVVEFRDPKGKHGGAA